jgi:hypothetical protein
MSSATFLVLLLMQSMVPVPPEAFLSVMMPAAAAGRMDVVRTMMGAVDQHLELQVRGVTLTALALTAGYFGQRRLTCGADVVHNTLLGAPSTAGELMPTYISAQGTLKLTCAA